MTEEELQKENKELKEKLAGLKRDIRLSGKIGNTIAWIIMTTVLLGGLYLISTTALDYVIPLAGVMPIRAALTVISVLVVWVFTILNSLTNFAYIWIEELSAISDSIQIASREFVHSMVDLAYRRERRKTVLKKDEEEEENR
jgi:ABC-type multidrug transport system fused ATPase/permease subunit